MKHVRIVTKNLPRTAFWWGWFGPAGELKSSGAKAAYIAELWATIGALDPRDL
ncbi:MAG: hypothetical protein JXR94_05330 [Candidatus Hydrogenedentes bacterium]|nr:hypothetical protein [Candidatus Hydrogenedentota bacterium]